MSKYLETVSHLKKKLEKGVGYEKTTGIGKTVRNVSKQNGDTDIGKTAKLICLTWKSIVKEQQEQEEQEYDPQEEPVVKEEPHFEQSFESSADFGHESPVYTEVKKEYNTSEDEDLNRSHISSEPSFHSNNDKRKYSKEDKKSDKKHKKHKSSHKSRESESKVSSKTEFETLLGLNDEIIKKKSPNKKSDSEKITKKSNNYVNNTYDKSYVKSETIESNETKYSTNSHNGRNSYIDSKPGIRSIEPSDILSSLPTPHYKPHLNTDKIEERIEANRKKVLKANEDLSLNVQSKKGRTAVFAGHARAKTYTHVPRLEDLCLQVLMDNYEKLFYLGDAPYYLLKPVLQKFNPNQLRRIEKINPQISEETNELWQHFCTKEFRGREPDEDEDESWRELYFRCVQEREDRLKNITKNISHKQAKALPVRQTQFSENVKTPREILRKQERSGISHSFGGPKSGFSGSSSSSSNHVKIVPDKPKVAPLMKKALKLQKARYRR